MRDHGTGADAMRSRSLPADTTSFVGRRSELVEIKRSVGDFRLVTLTGVGGVGKTRLALRAATELRRQFPDGVGWVELADLRDPSLLAQVIEDRLEIEVKSGRDPMAILREHLRERSLLLVLDNAEHLLDACADVVGELLKAAPKLRILVTSRQALGLAGECLRPIAPLEVPTADQAAEPGAGVAYPALVLFRERAEASAGTFALSSSNQAAVASICRKLDGIPLAIELATVKLKVLSVEELDLRLGSWLELLSPSGRANRSRHDSLQATINWSYELCTPEERILWARASVFVGGFGVDAAEICCSDDHLPREGVLNAISGLVDKSILTRSEVNGHTRFRFLEPLREHGLAELGRDGALARAQDRHLAWCANLISESCLQWFGPAQERWCVTLRLEQANVRAAAEHCLNQPGCEEMALSLLGEPWFLWVALFLDEGRVWLERALGLPSDPSVPRARALATAGYVAALQGDTAAAISFLDQSRAMAVEIGDIATRAYSTHVLGLAALFHDPDRAVQLLNEGLELYELDDDAADDLVVALRVQLGLALLFQGAIEESAAQFDLCHQLCTLTGERWLLSYALYGQAFIQKLRGDLPGSLARTREAVVIKRFFRDALGLAVCLDLMAWASAEAGEDHEAALLLGAASRQWDGFGARLFGSEHWLAQRRTAVEQCHATLGSKAYSDAFDAGERMSQEEALAFALKETAAPELAPALSDLVLTPRELEIADLVAEGLTNKAISERLVIAQRTAEGHVENVLAKFGFHSRSQIAAWVAERRIRH
ncbi:MAG: putative transcriptional regulator, LuxR family protein [Marmoricola sp.]|nr:putative transcriptional regulator, LuxR family protein [Marmoricola sp.]